MEGKTKLKEFNLGLIRKDQRFWVITGEIT